MLLKKKDDLRKKHEEMLYKEWIRSWNMPNRFDKYVGNITSIHNWARERFTMFTKPKKSIQRAFDHMYTQARKE